MNIFEQARKAHEQWKTELEDAVSHGTTLNVEGIRNHNGCEFGKWISHEGQQFLGLPSFVEMRFAHELFHASAAEVIHQSNIGNRLAAMEMMEPLSEFSFYSYRLLSALENVQKEAGPAMAGWNQTETISFS